MEENELKNIFNLIWKKKLQIITVIIISAIIGIIYTFKFVTPIYSSKVTLVLVSSGNTDENNRAITSSDVTINSKLISTYKELIKSDNVLKDVIYKLGIHLDIETLRNNIEVTSISNSGLIEVTVKNEDKEIVCKIANEVSRVFEEKVKELYNINNVQLINEAEVPAIPSNINHKKDILLFVAFGFLISGVYIFVLDILDTTVKSSENIEEEFGLPVLAGIPVLRKQKTKRKNKRRVNCKK